MSFQLLTQRTAQTIYEIMKLILSSCDFLNPNSRQTIIENINILPYLQNSDICYNYDTSLGTFEEDEIYSTREEAEQKLKEIKGEE